MNASRFHVSCIQKTDYRPHFICGGLLGLLEHFKHTEQCVNVDRLSANCVRAFKKDQKKLGTHAHHSDRSVAAAIFANGTYFVDTPRKLTCIPKIRSKLDFMELISNVVLRVSQTEYK
jgi:hypothetical protein